ncbi:MAG: hypothetical protein AAF959_14145 [Cyanobacteria bacterium P01_D01_bin.56]
MNENQKIEFLGWYCALYSNLVTIVDSLKHPGLGSFMGIYGGAVGFILARAAINRNSLLMWKKIALYLLAFIFLNPVPIIKNILEMSN